MQRYVLLSQLEETLSSGQKTYELATNDYGNLTDPRGYQYLQSFRLGSFPEFCYQAGDLSLLKTIACIQGENTTLIRYELLKAPAPVSLRLRTFVAARPYHNLCQANPAINRSPFFEGDILNLPTYPGLPTLYLLAPGSSWTNSAYWYYHFTYRQEQERGLDFQEDLFSHGYFDLVLEPGQVWVLGVFTEAPAGRQPAVLFEQERDRRQAIPLPEGDPFLAILKKAAGQFLINKPGGGRSVIAGYHWFTDWGRDTMIALPGLCVYNGQAGMAKEILGHFLSYLQGGMIPNFFPDLGAEPQYNTVDGSLWLALASYHYYRKTGDKEFLGDTLLGALEQIILAYSQGTRYQIHMDSDELLYAGEAGVQLTWMDARVGNWVVTPRMGKAVEINALWYNLWNIYLYFCHETGKQPDPQWESKPASIRNQFLSAFWNPEKSCLYDVVDGPGRDDRVRPNQLWAISLPFPLCDAGQADQILDCVRRELLTPRGLRSLSPQDPGYRPVYEGDQQSRDSAYHMGTVWSYLLGPYIDALIRWKGPQGRLEAISVLSGFAPHLAEAGFASISEIFDGDPPHRPRGCIAQAWSVGEILRVCVQYDLHIPLPSDLIRETQIQ